MGLRTQLRTRWHQYVDMLVPLRPDLHRYCRRLTGNIWDAEDLVQETLLTAFAQWGVTYPEIRDVRAYLISIATNAWIDTLRRRETEVRVYSSYLIRAGASSPGEIPARFDTRRSRRPRPGTEGTAWARRPGRD